MRKLMVATGILLIIALGWWGVRALIRSTILSVPADLAQASSVVGLGDSVTAGDGLDLGSNPTPEEQACLRSPSAYPNVIAQTGSRPVRAYACSGAQVANGLLQPYTVKDQTLMPQIQAAKPYLHGSLVVMTAGINDVGGLDLLGSCVTGTCNGSDLAALPARLQVMRQNLNAALAAIMAERPHKVLVNTYYYLLGPQDTCFVNYGVTAAKITRIHQLEQQLNDQISAAAKQAGATVVQIDFSGHTLCSRDPWIGGLGSPAPLHPNGEGQKNIAAQDLAVLH